MVWPSSWILVSGFCLSRLLNLVATDNWVQRPMQENKDTDGLVVTASYPWGVGGLIIHHQQIPLQA